MNGERVLASSSASIGTRNAGPGDQHSRAREGGRVAAADDSADGSFATDRGGLGRAAAGKLDGHRDHRRPDREQAGVGRARRASRHGFAGRKLDHLAEWLDQRSRLARRRSKAAGCRRTRRRPGSVRRSSVHVGFPVAAVVSFRARPGLKCARGQVAPSTVERLDAGAAADQQAIGDEAEGRNVDEAAALVDQIGEDAVDVGIFAGAGVG